MLYIIYIIQLKNKSIVFVQSPSLFPKPEPDFRNIPICKICRRTKLVCTFLKFCLGDSDLSLLPTSHSSSMELGQCCSRCGPRTNSLSITWKFIRNVYKKCSGPILELLKQKFGDGTRNLDFNKLSRRQDAC